MKKLFAMGAMLAFTFAVSAQVVKTKMKTKEPMNASNELYKAVYSSKFTMGNPRLANLVLKAWKDYENNTLENSNNILADTLTAVLPDGTVLKGKEAFGKGISAYRGSFTQMKIEVAAWMTTKSTDLNKETVLIWGSETGTKADGSSQKTNIHEVWFFNKDGKVDGFRQYIEQAPAK